MKQIIVAFFVCALLIPCAFGKRLPPKDISPIIYNGIKYTVPHWGFSKNHKQNGGYIEAYDEKSGKLLYELNIYIIMYDKNLEGDVQDIFITKMERRNNTINIWDEKGDKFVVNLNTKEVTPKNKIYIHANPHTQE